MASDGQTAHHCPSLALTFLVYHVFTTSGCLFGLSKIFSGRVHHWPSVAVSFLFDLGKIFGAHFSSQFFKKMRFYQALSEEKSLPNKIRQKPLPKIYWKKQSTKNNLYQNNVQKNLYQQISTKTSFKTRSSKLASMSFHKKEFK